MLRSAVLPFRKKVIVMSLKHFTVVIVLVFTVALAIQLGQRNRVEAKSPIPVPQSSQQAIEYAMLQADLEEDTVTWLIGGNDRVRTESVLATYRRLGGTGRGSFPDLLNQIGADGWRLVQKDAQTWIFSRSAR